MDRPNILLIHADQHRWDSLGCSGHPLARTPHLDALAAAGVRCDQAHTPTPVCVPARCSLITGRWPSGHGALANFDGEAYTPLPDPCPSHAAAVRGAGYRTAHIGRWHVDRARDPRAFGFDDYLAEEDYAAWRAGRGLPAMPPGSAWFGAGDQVGVEDSRPLWAARRVEDWLAAHHGGPFLLHWHLYEPHLPCQPPAELLARYDPAAIPPWPGFADSLAGKPFAQRQQRATWGIEGWDWARWAPAVARYLAVIECLDLAVGGVLAALDRLGLAERTLVIYSSDHGDMCGGHGMLDKHMVMYDDVVRVPLLARWPGVIPAGRRCDEFIVNAIDLAATCCAAAGAPPPAGCAGVDLLPALGGTGGTGREDVFATYSGNQLGAYSQRMVRDRRWKYVWNATAEEELYDTAADPGELVNRAGDAAARAELVRLRARTWEWMRATGDRLANPWIRAQLADGRRAAVTSPC